jgi:hypothetical protein
MSIEKKTLKQRAQEMSQAQLPIMVDRDKGEMEDLIGQIVTIRDYGFLTSEKGGEYAVFIVDEDPKVFYFGGKVLTDSLTEFDQDGFHADVLKDGLPVLFAKKKSKDKKNTYTSVMFYPEDQVKK